MIPWPDQHQTIPSPTTPSTPGGRSFEPSAWCTRCGLNLAYLAGAWDWHACKGPPRKPKPAEPRNRHERRQAEVLARLGPRTSKHSLHLRGEKASYGL